MKFTLLILFFLCAANAFSQTSLGAKNDFFSTNVINSGTGGSTSSVLVNDSLNSIPNSASTANVSVSWLTAAPAGFALNSDGSVSVAPGTAPDVYQLHYRICGIANPAICSEAYAVVLVDSDSDGDGISDLNDADADNDGIYNENECGIDIFSIYAPNNYTDNSLFLQLRPSDFGFTTPGATMLNGNHDYSSFFGLPTGSIIVNVENANVHPGADVFYVGQVTGTASKTLFKITGTLGVYLGVEHGIEFQGVTVRSISFLHGVTPSTGLLPVAVQPTGGNWQSGNIDQYYYLRHLTAGWENAPFSFGDLAPARKPKLFEVHTNNSFATNWSTYFVRIFPECDTDKDGIPNRLDLDSDNDGCPDALEGGNNYTYAQLVTAGGSLATANPNQNLCADESCVGSNGAPLLAGTGQAPGTAYDEETMSAVCIEALPVKLAYFNAAVVGHMVNLEWKTTQEQNSLGFEMERSIDGQIWQRISFVKSQAYDGNSTSSLTYSFFDSFLPNTPVFYRLKQLDFDGKFEYSEIRRVTIVSKENITVYPNPATDFIIIQGLRKEDIVDIYDAYGRKVKVIRNNTIQVSIADLIPGIYRVVVLGTCGEKKVFTFLKLR